MHWRDPVLVLAMTCSLPLRLGLPSHVHLVGSPVFDLPGPPGGHDACRLVMRRDDGRADAASAGIAVDAVDVQSGWGTLADAGMTGPVPVTGSPAASMAAVACGPAHLAAIDVVTHALTPTRP